MELSPFTEMRGCAMGHTLLDGGGTPKGWHAPPPAAAALLP